MASTVVALSPIRNSQIARAMAASRVGITAATAARLGSLPVLPCLLRMSLCQKRVFRWDQRLIKVDTPASW